MQSNVTLSESPARDYTAQSVVLKTEQEQQRHPPDKVPEFDRAILTTRRQAAGRVWQTNRRLWVKNDATHVTVMACVEKQKTFILKRY